MSLQTACRRAISMTALAVGVAGCSGGEKSASGPTGTSSSAVASLRVSLSDTIVTIGTTLQATSTALSSTGATIPGQPVRWSTSDATVATISGTGVVSPIKAGTFSVIAEALNSSGSVLVSGSATARARWTPGTWFLADSIVASFAGTWGEMVTLPLSGNRVALVIGGSDSGPNTTPDATLGCHRTPLAYLEVSAAGTLSQPTGRIVETTPTQISTGHLLKADFNGDGIADLFLAGTGCDVSQPPSTLRDVPKVLLGDANGGFHEVALASPVLQSHAAAIGVTRPGGPVDLMMLSGLCYSIDSPSDSLASQYRGGNWIPFCSSPGPFVFRGRGDGTFVYDNTSLRSEVARSIVGDGSPTVPNIAGGTLCDVNGDGANDLITTYKSAAPGRPIGQVYLNDKAGHFLTAPLALPNATSAGQLFTLLCRDLDGDGRMDLLATHNNTLQSDWQLYHGNGDGTFANITATAFPGQTFSNWTNEVNAADLNGDGIPDLVGGRYESKAGDQVPVWFGTAAPGVYRNAAPGEVPRISWTLGAVPAQITAWKLVPVTIGTETMLVSRVERSNRTASMDPQLAAIPLQSAVVRVFRRAP